MQVTFDNRIRLQPGCGPNFGRFTAGCFYLRNVDGINAKNGIYLAWSSIIYV